jgi:hypothetical protein
MLVILGGLPGTGKTTIARELSCRIDAVHVRIDSIEQALRDGGISVEEQGYRAAYAIAEDNLGVWSSGDCGFGESDCGDARRMGRSSAARRGACGESRDCVF